jgi:glycosyltransferase involved in cell wall biosynthesis
MKHYIPTQTFTNDNVFFFVATSTHNGKDRIRRLLDGMLAQTASNFVHYIYDDGSDSPADSIIEEYKRKAQERSKPFKVIYEKGPDLGLDLAYGRLFSKRTGTHFLWVDDDDYLAPTYLQDVQNEIVKNQGYTWFHTDRHEYEPSGKIREKTTADFCNRKRLANVDQFINFVGGVDFYYSSFVIESEMFSHYNPKCLFVDSRLNGGCYFDSQILSVLTCAHEKMYYIDRPLFFACMRGDSSFHTYASLQATKSDNAKFWLLTELGFDPTDVAFFKDTRNTFEEINTIRYICQIGNFEQAKKMIKDIKSYFARPDVPKSYRLRLSFVRQASLAVKFPWLYKFRQKIHKTK